MAKQVKKNGNPYRKNSKHAFVYDLLTKRSVAYNELRETLRKKYGEKTAGRRNTYHYVENVARKTGRVFGNAKDGWSIK
jgi:hypothetical protein